MDEIEQKIEEYERLAAPLWCAGSILRRGRDVGSRFRELSKFEEASQRRLDIVRTFEVLDAIRYRAVPGTRIPRRAARRLWAW